MLQSLSLSIFFSIPTDTQSSHLVSLESPQCLLVATGAGALEKALWPVWMMLQQCKLQLLELYGFKNDITLSHLTWKKQLERGLQSL